jgi:cytochrome c
MLKRYFWVFSLLAFFAACKKNDIKRANDPWVFRSVLDKQPRMVTIALNENLWAAYRTDSCALYKVWKGGVNFDGPVYTTHHGPQPISMGDAFTENNFHQPWLITENGQTKTVTPDYKGHIFRNGRVSLMFDIPLADGKKVRVEESPEYRTDEQGTTIFERTFTTKDAPANIAIGIKVNVSSVATPQSIVADNNTWTITKTTKKPFGKIEYFDIEGVLTLKNDAKTNLNIHFARPSIENPWDDALFAKNENEGDKVHPGLKLMEKSDCQTCHNEVKYTVGPSYVAIAKKYENTEEIISKLTTKVKVGGAGVWGKSAMTAHLTTPESDIRTMVEYIMSLDKDTEKVTKTAGATKSANFKSGDNNTTDKDMLSGLMFQVYQFDALAKLPTLTGKEKPIASGVLPEINVMEADLKDLPSHTYVVATGYLNIPKDNSYAFRIGSDDGSRLTINGQIVADNDGCHGMAFKDTELALKKGFHPIKVEYFQATGGKSLSLQWTGDDSGEFVTIPSTILSHKEKDEVSTLVGEKVALSRGAVIPGDGSTLQDVHPSYTLSQARPDDFTPKVGGMDFDKKGNLIVSTWDPAGSVYKVKNPDADQPWKMKAQVIANGLAEPLGLKVIEGNRIFVLQKQELTELIDHDGDGMTDEYRTVANGWRVSGNFHEFAFGLVYKDNYFYATLATAINPGGASTRPQIPDRGKVVKIDPNTGKCEFIAHGLRTPNGIAIGVDGELFVADNQGDWLPSSKIVHIKPGAFYGSHSVDSAGTWNTYEQPPVVWLPQDEIGNSPSQPSIINDGSPYAGQMIHGEVTHGGVKRVFVEKVNGNYQGAVFEFTQGLEAGVNRLCWGPDKSLYIGGIGAPGNWGHTGKQWYGLQKMKYNGTSAFEMLAIRAKTNGVEIELTEPLKPEDGWNPKDYLVKQWWYKPTIEYGGPKMDEEQLEVSSASVSADGKKVFLELKGMKAGHLVYVRLKNKFISQLGHGLWATEGWYNMNNIPENNAGQVIPHTLLADNVLTDYEKQQGWQLLFNGSDLSGWRNFKKQTIGKSWIVEEGAIHLAAVKNDKGGWQAPDGGDIITNGEYENYEFSVDWKIDRCGNSGIIYNVVESEKYGYVWMTGPEMQVLDNSCHPDSRIEKHRAGDLYDLIKSKYETVKPAGEWNRAILKINNGHLEHWLNGMKVVETTLWTKEWNDLVAKSKFPGLSKDFGTARKGHIALQDHGDKVWFKNIKIRPLPSKDVASR